MSTKVVQDPSRTSDGALRALLFDAAAAERKPWAARIHMIDIDWFLLRDARSRKLDSSVWIPLRAIDQLKQSGDLGRLGFEEEFFGAGTVAVRVTDRSETETLGWSDVGISHSDEPYFDNGQYIASDVYKPTRAEVEGIRLVIDQRGNHEEHDEWHLHQDLVVALGLRREGNRWLAIHEGYIEAARLLRNSSGGPRRLEIRSEFLKDYLCARGMALYVSWYRKRVRVVEPISGFPWLQENEEQEVGLERWSGRAWEIHEGGWVPFGAKTAVFHASQTGIPVDEDVPQIPKPGDGDVDSRSLTFGQAGRKLMRIEGEVWKREWIEPAEWSPRIRGDSPESTVHFKVDAAGRTEVATALRDGGGWLWFRPNLIRDLAERRGGRLEWYTRDTGSVAASPDESVHFGLNSLGLVTAYAKDVALLPEWQQRIWAGHNISPEGGISEELHASQVLAMPAETEAPETLLKSALDGLNRSAEAAFGIRVLRDHDGANEILSKTHRFQAVNEAGLYALAKDIARLTADRINASAIHKIVAPPKGQKWGSLKSLQHLVASVTTADKACSLMGPLFAAYELRQGDAHLASDLQGALVLAGVDPSKPPVHQGRELLAAVVSALQRIAAAISNRRAAAPAPGS